MRTIWKYHLQLANPTTHSMPVGAEILTVQRQHDAIVLWALVDDAERAREMREFLVVDTGQAIPDELDVRYLGTVQERSEAPVFVWHVFEILKQKEQAAAAGQEETKQ